MKALEDIHLAQCLNYLKATGLQTCLLLNFGKAKVEVRRLGMSRGQATMQPDPVKEFGGD